MKVQWAMTRCGFQTNAVMETVTVMLETKLGDTDFSNYSISKVMMFPSYVSNITIAIIKGVPMGMLAICLTLLNAWKQMFSVGKHFSQKRVHAYFTCSKFSEVGKS